jgi:hypothetical protein
VNHLVLWVSRETGELTVGDMAREIRCTLHERTYQSRYSYDVLDVESEFGKTTIHRAYSMGEPLPGTLRTEGGFMPLDVARNILEAVLRMVETDGAK